MEAACTKWRKRLPATSVSRKMSLKCRLSSRWPGLTISQDNGCGDGAGLKGVGLTVNHLILDDEHVSGGGDEGDEG